MSEPARPIPVKLDVETLAALDALVAAGRQPTRSAAIRAGIELLLDAEHRRALDLGLGTDRQEAASSREPARPRSRRQAVVGGPAVTGAALAERIPAPALVPPQAPEPLAAEEDADETGSVVDLRPAASRTAPQPSGPRPGLSVDW